MPMREKKKICTTKSWNANEMFKPNAINQAAAAGSGVTQQKFTASLLVFFARASQALRTYFNTVKSRETNYGKSFVKTR